MLPDNRRRTSNHIHTSCCLEEVPACAQGRKWEQLKLQRSFTISLRVTGLFLSQVFYTSNRKTSRALYWQGLGADLLLQMGGGGKQHNIKVPQSGSSQRATYPSSRLLNLWDVLWSLDRIQTQIEITLRCWCCWPLERIRTAIGACKMCPCQ
jgi:hypothetical protein